MPKQNKKILFLINKLGIGGAERVFIKTANVLTEHGYEIYFGFLFGDEKDQNLISDLKVNKDNIFYCKARSIFDLNSLKKLSTFIKGNKIDIVYSTLNEANIFARFLKILNVKISMVIREANVADDKPIKFKFLDVILNRLVNKIVCVSEDVKRTLVKYQPFYKNKMVVLMNGIDIPEISKQYPKEISLPLKILNVGSLNLKKGQKFLIEACSMVDKKIPNSFNLTIIGSGVEKENLNKQIISLGLENKVFIKDVVSPEKLSAYYLNSDMFVLSSLWEGCPNVLLEASAFGLACISTKVSGATDIIEDEQTGKITELSDSVKLAEAIVSLIKNRQGLAGFGKKARDKMIKEFSFSVYISKFFDLF